MFDVLRSPYVQKAGELFFVILFITLVHRYKLVSEFMGGQLDRTYADIQGESFLTKLFWQMRSAVALGIITDILFSFCAALVASIFPRFVRVFFIIALTFFYVANIEHLQVNFAPVELGSIGLAADLTFISAHLFSYLFLRGLVIALVLVGVAACFARLKWVRTSMPFFALLLLSIALVSPKPFNYRQSFWLQSHPLFSVLGRGKVAEVDDTFSNVPFQPSGPITPGNKRYNILVVYLEGLSQVSIDAGEMETLDRLGEQNVELTRFIAPQIITANGLYSSFTGRLPRFTTTDLRWYELEDNSDIVAQSLPQTLSDLGYQTSYLQSADLTYMEKDVHLATLGFENLVGNQDWIEAYGRNGWGVDDRTLFEGTLDHIDTLQNDKPWFVSILTTGTHSPYNVPDDFLPEPDGPPRYRALRYADAAIAEMMDGLQARGLLESTIVIFTADESRESSARSPLANEILLNWLPFIIVHPDGIQRSVDHYVEMTSSRDLILSFATGVPFERIETEVFNKDPILFGNVYSRRLFWFDQAEKSLLICENSSFYCGRIDDVENLMTKDLPEFDGVSYYPNLKSLVMGNE